MTRAQPVRDPWLVTAVSAAVLVTAMTPVLLGQASSVVNSPHNLSASGPGAIRASGEQEVCIFCHTPHNATPVQPLWNRHLPVNAYTVYSSSSLQASPGQPTGSSKLCLSCHDGTIALGSVVSRGQPIMMAGGITTLPPGQSNLGTDLSDDHPISFRYDSHLVTRNQKLTHPGALPPRVRLDGREELQCTTCHDAHDNSFGSFLVMDNTHSQLCGTCHNQGMTTVEGHVQCGSCHQPHSAPSGPHLLRGSNVSSTCLTCHSSGFGPDQGPNVATDLNKVSRHDKPPAAQEQHLPGSVTCRDCHEPHTMGSFAADAPNISPRLGKVSGVDASGQMVAQARYEYEVCLKCHGDHAAVQNVVTRQIVQNNKRLAFDPSAVSYHPVMAPGRNTFVPSLRPGLSSGSMIYCTDCHASDTSNMAGSVAGPHGSNVRPLLAARYDMIDNSPESAAAYALCYTCHERSSILGDHSFAGHRKHIVDEGTPCSVCHDAHGISSAQGTSTRNAALINFDVTVVSPDPVTGQLEFMSTGQGQGRCYLKCHGKAHSPLEY